MKLIHVDTMWNRQLDSILIQKSVHQWFFFANYVPNMTVVIISGQDGSAFITKHNLIFQNKLFQKKSRGFRLQFDQP